MFGFPYRNYLITLCILVLGALPARAVQQTDFRLPEKSAEIFNETSAYQLLESHLKAKPELGKRLLDSTYRIPNKDWSYGSQTYGSREVMLHLIALQIKAMAERGEIQSIDDIFDPKYGIGSKNHKDKGTINNALSIFGHPVQTEILGRRGRLFSLRVYHAFRKTVKNELIRYARNQSIDWHLRPAKKKLQDSLDYLRTKYPKQTEMLEKELQKNDLDLPTLLYAAIDTHLLS